MATLDVLPLSIHLAADGGDGRAHLVRGRSPHPPPEARLMDLVEIQPDAGARPHVAPVEPDGMRRLRVSRCVAVPPPVVWDLLVTVAQWPRWGPSVRGVELDTARITLGSRGVIETVAGVRLPFEITCFEPDRAWSWTIRGVRATDHTLETTDAGTRVSFGVPWLAGPYLGVCAVALRRLERLAVLEIRP